MDLSENQEIAATSSIDSSNMAVLAGSHKLIVHLNKTLEASPSAHIAMAIGELATAMDHAARGKPFAVAVSAIQSGHKLGFTALTLAALWGRWGQKTCLLGLSSDKKGLAGGITASRPDLKEACAQVAENGRLSSISQLHKNLPDAHVIMAGDTDVLQLLSMGKLKLLIDYLKKTHDRIVVATPALSTAFPFLSLNDCCDRLVMSLLAGKSTSGPLRELAKHAMMQGMRPIEAIWHDG